MVTPDSIFCQIVEYIAHDESGELYIGAQPLTQMMSVMDGKIEVSD